MASKDIVADFTNLHKAYKKAKAGKKYNSSAVKFSSMSLEGIWALKEQLENQTYKMAPYNEFEIYEPKKRVIKSCSFKDKVVQHSLCDNILLPELEKVFITDNYAGQIGKGALFGLERLKQHMTDFYNAYGLNGWILKCDIKKYFYSIDHEVLKDIVDYYFNDDYLIWLNHVFIDSDESPGLPLGNQVAQVYALLILHLVDSLIVGEQGFIYYGRYMDDFFVIHHDKEYLKECLKEINALVLSLGLELNGKTQIIPFKQGIKFLGFHHYISSDGKYIRKINGENKRRIKKKLRKWSIAVKDGKMTEKKFFEKYGAWKNHALHGNCKKLCHNMDLYVDKLIRKTKVV